MGLKAGLIFKGWDEETNIPPDEWKESMAQAMENAFVEVWPKVMGSDIQFPGIDDNMRLLFIVVAKGVVNHLQANADAFQITLNEEPNHDHSVSVNNSGTYQTSESGEHAHSASMEIEVEE